MSGISTFGSSHHPTEGQVENPDRIRPQKYWETLITNCQAYDVFLTVGFRVWLDSCRAEYSINHFLLRLNRSLYGKYFKNRGNWLCGVGVVEYKALVSRSGGSPHFHFALRLPDGGMRRIDEIAIVANNAAARLKYPTFRAERPFGRAVSGPDFVDVRRIYSQRGLANYMTKRIGLRRDGLNAANVFFLGIEGVVGLDLQIAPFRG